MVTFTLHCLQSTYLDLLHSPTITLTTQCIIAVFFLELQPNCQHCSILHLLYSVEPACLLTGLSSYVVHITTCCKPVKKVFNATYSVLYNITFTLCIQHYSTYLYFLLIIHYFHFFLYIPAFKNALYFKGAIFITQDKFLGQVASF
jgi:hypothetical protein